LAGFQTSLIGRFWVSPEALPPGSPQDVDAAARGYLGPAGEQLIVATRPAGVVPLGVAVAQAADVEILGAETGRPNWDRRGGPSGPSVAN